MTSPSLPALRAEIAEVNASLLELLSRRAAIVQEIHALKARAGLPTFVPERELAMLNDLTRRNPGPFTDATIRHLFKEIFRASVALMDDPQERPLRVSRSRHADGLKISLGSAVVGEEPVIIAGPCAVESAAQLEEVAARLARLGVRFLRGGAFKPRSSPYSFQGLGLRGLELLSTVARRHHLLTVSEVVDPRYVELMCRHVDILQVGSRNMYNYELLREVGRSRVPVLLKRGLAATLDELLWSAEYIVLEGNERVILCERGIRTFETQTRNTLDISAVALLRQRTFLPVMVDVSHAAGRRDILVPLARAALAAGAQGLMVEVHPCPAVARSDSEQQLDLEEFRGFLANLGLPHGMVSPQPGVRPAVPRPERTDDP